jgi:hypothetical protein
MGEYANVKRKRFNHLIKWLSRNFDIQISAGGRHNILVRCIHNGEKYPIPASHGEINKHIVKSFMEWLVKYEICTKEEFDRNI